MPLLVAALLLAPSVAGAHVELDSFQPGRPAPADEPPTRVELVFSTDVEDTLDEVVVTAPDGATPAVEPVVDGTRVEVALPDRVAEGTWTVEYAVIGPDGHPVRGSRTFVVGAATAPVSGAAYPVDTLSTISLVGRVVFFVSLLLFVGGGLFALYPARGFVPAGWGGMAINVTLGALAVVGMHAAISERRSLLGMLDPRAWIEAMLSTGGRGYALAAIAVLLALRLGRRRLAPDQWRARGGATPWAVVALLGVAVAGPTLSSHAMQGDWPLVRIPLDVLHVAAASAWIGGLVQLLALTVARRAHNPAIPGAVERYSRIAFASVATLVVTGAYAAWNELGGSIGDLFGTTYGRLVLFKVVLLAATVPLAKANKEHHVPDLREVGPASLPRLRRFVAWEFAIVLWIVVATAALVYETPPGDASPGDHAAHMAAPMDTRR